MKFERSDRFDKKILEERMMGPNAMRIAEELSESVPMTGQKRILDLGCGKGLSSYLLAKKYPQALIVAVDLGVPPEDNAAFFQEMGIAHRVIPMSLDAAKPLPFAKEYFDLVFSVGSYHYYGRTEEMLPQFLSYLKQGGYIAVAIPGVKEGFEQGPPEELKPFLKTEETYFLSGKWWKALWEKEERASLEVFREMDCLERAWEDWLSSENPLAIQNRPMMSAEGGTYFNLVQMVAKKQTEQ